MKTLTIVCILAVIIISDVFASFSTPILRKSGSQECLEFQTIVELSQGWNLISVSFPFADASITNLIEPVKHGIVVIWGWDKKYGWRYYRPDSKSNTLHYIEPGKGYWIYSQFEGKLLINKSFCWETP